MDLLRELLVGRAAIALKGGKQGQIEGIEGNHANLLR
ncbi:protein of unknown function [Ralstonia solanacearum CFBP2957]|nr:protein of unknown function [Ralstonia solanacearum CFBP2957]